MPNLRIFQGVALGLLPLGAAGSLHGQSVPFALQGRWRITRILARTPAACWDDDRARTLLGSTLGYGGQSIRWQGGEVPLIDQLAVSRNVTAKAFSAESGLTLASLGIESPAVREIDLQHEDADITGGSTEVPGDTVLLAGPGRIVISACGVYYSASRLR